MNNKLMVVGGAWLIALIPTWLSVRSAGGFGLSHWLPDLVIWIWWATMLIGCVFFATLLRYGARRSFVVKWSDWSRSQRVFVWILGFALVALIARTVVGSSHPHEPDFWARSALLGAAFCNVGVTFQLSLTRRSGAGPESSPVNRRRGLAGLADETAVNASTVGEKGTQRGHA